MSRFRSTFHGRQVCHRLELPEVLRHRRRRQAPDRRQERREPGTVAESTHGWLEPMGVALGPLSDGALQETIGILEKRLLKLTGALEDQESLLAQMRQQKGAEPGLASTFRAVQGLNPGQTALELKRTLMRRIFESNQELRERITSLHRLAE
ncbi:MAG: hypothetical protein H6830_03955 [Planctomycetes bacterium]|nr:hypothetical protein [Planctomycetota bacterium]